MTLDEQLEELRGNILRDRSDMLAGDPDWSWSDETLVRYIGDAERRFARRTLVLRDATTPEVCQFKLRTGVTLYPLHESVIAVVSARLAGAELDLPRTGHAPLWCSPTPDQRPWYDPVTVVALPPGPPIAYHTDESLVYDKRSRVTFSVHPAPSAAEDGTVVTLRVVRLPLCGYSVDKLERESELPEDYHLDVLSWAAYRALRGFDADTGAPTSAEAHKVAFEEAVRQAIRDTRRKLFTPVGVGYGRNGWVW